MSGVIMLAKRNILMFFRDKPSVFFSLMAVLIVIMLYLLFLRNLLIESMLDGGLDFASDAQVSNLMDSWVLAGILGIVSVTSAAGSLQCMVEDKVAGKNLDFKVTPMKSYQLSLSYVISTSVVGLVMSAITFVIALVFLFVTDCIMDTSSMIICAVLLIPSTLSGSIILFAMVSFIKSQGAFSGFFSVLSTLIGFLTGIYMPLGNLPEGVQFIGTLMPATHMAALFRNYLCSGSMADVFGPFDTSEFRSEMGIDLSIGGYTFTSATSVLYVVGVTIVFFALSIYLMRKK